MSRNVKRTAIAVAFMIIVIIAAILWFVFDYRSVKGAADDSHISVGVHIGSVDVSGMTADEAEDAVDAYVESLGEHTLTLTEAENNTEADVPVSDLGLYAESPDKLADEALSYGKTGNIFERYQTLKRLQKEDHVIPMEIRANEDEVRKVVEDHTKKFEVPAKDATIKKSSGGFDIKEEETGVKVDIEKSVEAINDFLSGEWDEESGKVALAVTEDVPKVTKADLEQIEDTIGTATTNYSTSASGRKKNVASGAEHIDGTVVMPGETFSVYETVSPFTEENGYALAHAYENGQVVDSMGGGICQVSSTLYNAVLAAELEVVERSPHSMIVTYVEPSKDAAIAGTYKDFKFKNDGDVPIFIQGSTDGAYITFTIYGKETRPENRTVEYVSEIISTTEPETKYVATSAPLGEQTETSAAHVGKKAKLWKIVYVDGKEESRTEVNSSTYKASESVVEVGTKSDDKKAVKEIKAAIKAQDEAAIKAAVKGAEQREKEKEEEEKKKEEEEKKKEAEAKKKAAAAKKSDGTSSSTGSKSNTSTGTADTTDDKSDD